MIKKNRGKMIKVEMKNIKNWNNELLFRKTYSELINFKIQRCLLVRHFFNIAYPVVNNKDIYNLFILNKFDLHYKNIDKIVIYIKFLIKHLCFNKNVKKVLKIFIKYLKIRKKILLKKYVLYLNDIKFKRIKKIDFDIGINIYKDLWIKRFKKFDLKKNLQKVKAKADELLIKFDKKKFEKKRFSKEKIKWLKSRFLRQKIIIDNIKNFKKRYLLFYQYLDQRKSNVSKIKWLTKKNSIYYKGKNLVKWFLQNIFFKKIYRRKKKIYVKRRNKKLLKYNNFKDFVKKWNKNRKFYRKFILKRRRRFTYFYNKMKKYKTRFKKTRTAILHFKSYNSNYYITLTDLSYNVIFSCSAGSVSYTNSKKTKMSTIVCTPMFIKILIFLKAYKIRSLKFESKTGLDKHFRNAFDFFRKRNVFIKTLSLVFREPHHLGQRENKPRRV